MEQTKSKKVNIYRKISQRLSICTSNKYTMSDYVPYTRVDSVDFKKIRSKPLKKQRGMANLRPMHNMNETIASASPYFDKHEISVLYNINESFNPNTSLTSMISKPCSVESENPSSEESSFISKSSESNNSAVSSTGLHENIYVCCKPYSARLQGDLSLNEAERVVLIVTTNEYSLVRNENGDCGYVANDCIKISF